MGLFLAVWAGLLGWPFAVGATAIILLHEVGHIIGGALRGISTRPPVFIPFIGAFVSLKEEPRSAYDEAVLAAGGPVLGLLATTCVWAVHALYPDPVFLDLARFGFALHAVNLVPILPFDGGRIAAAVSVWVGRVMRPLAVFLAVWGQSYFLAWLFGSHHRAEKREPPPEYHVLPGRQRMQAAAGFLGLLAFSLLGYLGTGAPLSGLLFLGMRREEPLPLPLTWTLGATVVILLVCWGAKFLSVPGIAEDREPAPQAAEGGER